MTTSAIPRGFILALIALLPGAVAARAQTPFVDVTDAAGLTHDHAITQTILALEDLCICGGSCECMDEVPLMSSPAEIMSTWITGGVAAGDYDGDGDVDLFVLGGDAGQSRLFRNDGPGAGDQVTFTDVAAAAGVLISNERASGAVFADYDGDGDLDLWVGGALSTPPRLFRNDGPGAGGQITFTDVFATALAGYDVARNPNSWGGAFGDYDGDGDLDLFIPHSMTPSGPDVYDCSGLTAAQCDALIAANPSQHLWRNEGDGTFTDVSYQANVSVLFESSLNPASGWGTGVSDLDQTFSPNFADVDGDGDADLLISGDIGSSRVLINQGDGTFQNLTAASPINGNTAMGTAVADFDNDGNLDWFVSHVRFDDPTTGNRLYQGLGDGTFAEVTEAAGVRDGHWGWGACAADFDNDRRLDVFHVNGFYYPGNPFSADGRFTGNPAVLFHANPGGTFTELAALVGIADANEGRGVSCFDFDRDGDVDVAIANNNGPFRLYENVFGDGTGFLEVRLAGRPPNTEGIGARLTVRSENAADASDVLTHEIRAGSNFQSSNPAEAHFGLGDWQGPLEVRVAWPDGLVGLRRSVPAASFLVLDQALVVLLTEPAFQLGEPIVLEASAHSLGGMDVSSSIRWSLRQLDNVVGSGPTVDLSAMDLPAGSYPMFASVTDPQGTITSLPFALVIE